MTEQRRKLLINAGYGAFFAFATMLFVYSTFPIEAVQGRINKELQKQMPQWSVAFERASPYRLTGLDIEDLALTIQQGDSPSVVQIDRVKARLNVLPLLKGRYTVSYDVTLGDSEVVGVAATGEESQALQLAAEELDLGRLPPMLYKMIGTRLNGSSTADIDIVLDSTDPKKSSGSGSFEIRRAGLGGMTLKNIHPMMPGELSIPPVDLGSIDIAFEIKDGALKIKKMTQKGGDLEARITGEIGLRKQFNYSTLSLQVEFKLSESFVQKNPKFAILAGGRKTPDGFSSIKVGGTIQTPSPQM